MDRAYTMLMADVAALMAAHGSLLCAVDVEIGKDTVITLRLPYSDDSVDTARAAKTLNLVHGVEYLRDVAQIRALAMRFEIPADKLEALLPER